MSFLNGEMAPKKPRKRTHPEKIWELLKDGKYRSKREIAETVGCSEISVKTYINDLRKRLPEGQMILCEFQARSTGYRRVRAYRELPFA